MKTIPGKIVILMVGMILIIGLMILQQFTNVFASTSLIPRATPFSTPTNPAYPPPGRGMMPMENTAYPPPSVPGGEKTQISPPIIPTMPLVTATAEPVKLANGWYLYNDTEGGLSITYPLDAYISSSKNKSLSIYFRLPGVNSLQGMQIVIYPNPDNLPIEEVISSKIFNNSRNLTKEQIKSAMIATNIAGLPFFTMKDPLFDTIALLSLGKKVYFISPLPDMMAGNPPDPQAVKVFFSILETIRITSNP